MPVNAVPIGNAPKECLVESQVKGISSNTTAKQRPPHAPLAIIMEVRKRWIYIEKVFFCSLLEN
jgi:hypothetical protein